MMHFTDLTTMSRSLHALYRSLFLGGIGNSAIRALPILLMCVKFSYRGTHYALPQWIYQVPTATQIDAAEVRALLLAWARALTR